MSGITKPVTKGCWTCKSKKIQCDRGTPACQRCIQSSRHCQGYSPRLSWPKAGDKRRVITFRPASNLSSSGKRWDNSDHIFISTNVWDIRLHYQLVHDATLPSPAMLRRAAAFTRRPDITVTQMELLDYFKSTAYSSLVMFNPLSRNLSQPLMRMALFKDTGSSQALFYALLAFSSLHKYGMNQQVVTFKLAALQALSVSSTKLYNLNVADAIQHVAACMLLCAFEILVPSETSGDWLWYVWGATSIIQETRLQDTTIVEGINITHLLDWFYYHYSLSRFTMRHWNHKTVKFEATKASQTHNSQCPRLAEKKKSISQSQNPSHKILNALGEICDTLIDPRDPRSEEKEYKEHLRSLQHRVRTISLDSNYLASDKMAQMESATSVRVYQIATLVYIQRAYHSPEDESGYVDELVEEAFKKHVGAYPCSHFFPLFILACEARTEEKRAAFLELIRMTEKQKKRSMQWLIDQIKRVWIQLDLHTDSDLLIDYLGLMNAITSSNRALPSYV